MSRRIAAGFAFVLMLVVIVAVIGLVAVRRSSDAYRSALRHQTQFVVPALRAQSDFRRARVDHLRYLASPDSAVAASMDSILRLSRRLLAEVRDSASTDDEGRRDWETAQRAIELWEVGARASMTAARGGRGAEALRIRDSRVAPAADSTRDAINRGVERTEKQAGAALLAGEATARRLGTVVLIGGLLALGFGVLASVLLNRAISGPLRATAEVLYTTAAEILAATTQQALGASESSAAVAETVATVDEVTQTAEHAAQRAKTVADTSRRAAEMGETGRRTATESAHGMTGVSAQVDSIAVTILALAERAQAIGEIIATVNDIAEQTNLLALNAAVEAARAGDQGRGFAVVAGEVKNLAEQSKRATIQVRQILGEIQRATNAAVLTTEQGTKQVAAAGKQVTEAGETIRLLAQVVGETAQSAVQIVASAGQQAVGMEQIRQAMANIHQATQQNLASTKQSERAAQDLNALGLELLAMVGRSGRTEGVTNRSI